jgi:DNA-binding transcriptional ArsR family regulator
MNGLRLEWGANIGVEGLLGLSAFSSSPEARLGSSWWSRFEPSASERDSISAVGDPTGEIWLHLLGPALDCTDYPSFVALLRGLSSPELLELALGAHVPAWMEVVDRDVLVAAASGDAGARSEILGSSLYYAGRAREALGTLLEMSPDEAATCILGALDAWAPSVARAASRIQGWQADRRSEFELLTGSALKRLQALTGLRYEPEPYVEKVVVIPSMIPAGLILAQHDASRLVVFSPDRVVDPLTRLSALFSALGEGSRLDILRLLAREPRGVSEIAAATGLAKSTVHQHLGLLRSSGAITLAGHAWRYRYEVDRGRLAEAMNDLLREIDREEGK